jgi:hypothetical protein
MSRKIALDGSGSKSEKMGAKAAAEIVGKGAS